MTDGLFYCTPMYCTIAIALRSDTTVCAYLCYSLLGLACARNENMQLVIHYMLKNKHTSKSTGDSFDQPQFQHALLSSWIFVSGSQNGCALSFAGSFCLYIGFPWISHIFLFDIMRLEHFGLVLLCLVPILSHHVTPPHHLHIVFSSDLEMSQGPRSALELLRSDAGALWRLPLGWSFRSGSSFTLFHLANCVTW